MKLTLQLQNMLLEHALTVERSVQLGLDLVDSLFLLLHLLLEHAHRAASVRSTGTVCCRRAALPCTLGALGSPLLSQHGNFRVFNMESGLQLLHMLHEGLAQLLKSQCPSIFTR